MICCDGLAALHLFSFKTLIKWPGSFNGDSSSCLPKLNSGLEFKHISYSYPSEH